MEVSFNECGFGLGGRRYVQFVGRIIPINRYVGMAFEERKEKNPCAGIDLGVVRMRKYICLFDF